MIEDRTVAKIAELFYMQGVSQNEIARIFNFSTAKVCRLIKEAKARGIIEFRIKKFDKRILELEREMQKAYMLKEVFVYYNSDIEYREEDLLFQEVGALAAGYLEKILEDGLNIALAWGKTLYSFINNVNVDKKFKVNIFSTLGGANLLPPEYQNNSLVQVLSEKVGGTAYPVYLPLILDSPVKELLKNEDSIEKFLGSADKIDYYFHGIGTVSENARLYPHHGFNDNFIKSLKEKGIVGEVGFNFFNINGNFVESGIENRSIRLNNEKIKKIKNKVTIACGKEKAEPLTGFLRTGLCDVLVTDSRTAALLLKKT
jgi:deoxyribonucleoside regulator